MSLHLCAAASMTMFGFVVQMGGLEKKAERRLAEQTAAIGNASATAERPGLGESGMAALGRKADSRL